MISTSRIFGTGEKKCSPMNRDGSPTADASPVIGNVDVFDAITASGNAEASAVGSTSFFSSRFSNTASITRSQPARSAAPALTRVLENSRNTAVRLRAAGALFKVDGQIETTVPVLLEMLDHKETKVRIAAIETLGEFRGAGVVAVPALAELHEADPREEVQDAIDAALEHIGRPDRSSVAELARGLQSSNARFALESARALGMEVTAAHEARRRTYNEKLLRMDPAEAARIVVDGVEAGKGRVRVGRDAKMVDRFVRLVPERYPRLVVAFDKRLREGGSRRRRSSPARAADAAS